MASDWLSHQAALHDLARRPLFFIGGPPRSGTTWVQRLAAAHPAVGCRGEGLFQQRLADPIDKLYADYRDALAEKRRRLFSADGGYPPVDDDEADLLLGTAVLLALRRQNPDARIAVLGEKTPENVFLFPRLKRLFPRARFVGVARDPRDVAVSAWHLFGGEDRGADARAEFIAAALPQISMGLRAMLALERQFPADCLLLTYEALSAAPQAQAARLFGFLGVDACHEVLEACVDATRFEALTGGRRAGDARDGAFLRFGAPGAWTEVFTPDLADLALQETGWAFERFGWVT